MLLHIFVKLYMMYKLTIYGRGSYIMQMHTNGRVLQAALEGELDHYAAERFRAQIDTAFEKSACKHILLDLSEVSFMDSSGIGMLIGRYKKAETRGGRLAVCGMSKAVCKLFEISGLGKIVSQAKTENDALALLGGPLV